MVSLSLPDLSLNKVTRIVPYIPSSSLIGFVTIKLTDRETKHVNPQLGEIILTRGMGIRLWLKIKMPWQCEESTGLKDSFNIY